MLSGQIAQNFIINLLRANGLNIQTDNTTPQENDNFDFSVKGYIFDVKCSLTTNVPMQVSLTSAKKRPHYFIFCRLSDCLKVIEIVGVVRAIDVLQERYIIRHNEIIPNSRLKQMFVNGSYFYTGVYKSIENLLMLKD